MKAGHFGLTFCSLVVAPMLFSLCLGWETLHPDGPRVGVPVKLLAPSSPSPNCAPSGTDLCLSLNANHELRLNGALISRTELCHELGQQLHPTVYFWADPSLKHHDAISAMDEILSAGAKIILIQSTQQAPVKR
jgi:biopolymer transport protein ExbD